MKSSLIAALGTIAPVFAADWTWAEAEGKSIKFTSVPGYFLQDNETTSPTGFDYATSNFGLIDRSYPTDKHFDPAGEKSGWERLDKWLSYLNSGCQKDGNIQYKLFFFGRHGNGYHNAAESFYGTPAWNCYWAERDGNATATWRDALLTGDGEREALKANAYFKSRYEELNMPHFESYYASPLARCGETATLTFGDIEVPADRPFAPIVKEGFREGMTVHTCNWRRNKTVIAEMFPNFTFEDGFTEADELWRADLAETEEAFAVRAKNVLDDVFRTDDKAWLSVTAHSGAITRLLGALNHRPFRLATGQIIPVLVKAEVIDLQPTPTVEAHEPYSTCDAPPLASNAEQGCICAATSSSALPEPTESGECPA